MDIYPVPPQDFCDRLRNFDSDLSLNWDPNHGVWAIWHKDSSTSEVSHVMNVVEPDGSYRTLDDRVFQGLRVNKFYAYHPELLEAHLIDSIKIDRERQQKFTHDEMAHLAKDKSLNKRFNAVKEEAARVSWNDWKKPQQLSGGMYVPHDSIKRG